MKMKSVLCACLLAVFVLPAVSEFYVDEDGVMKLEDLGFQEYLETHELVVCHFYAPWSKKDQKLAVEYAKAAAIVGPAAVLKDESESQTIQMVKVDATRNRNLAMKWGVKGFPTILVFRKEDVAAGSRPMVYSGANTASDIVSFAKKVKETGLQVLNSASDLEAFREENPWAIIGIFASFEDPAADVFIQVSQKKKHLSFALVFDEALASQMQNWLSYETKIPAVVVMNEEHQVAMPGVAGADFQAMKTFVLENYLPSVVIFSSQNQQQIYSHPVKKFLLFFSGETGDGSSANKYMDELLRPVAIKNRGKLHTLVITHDYAAMHAKGGLLFLRHHKSWPMAAIVEQEKGMALITRYTVGPAEEFMNKPHTHEKLQKYIDKFLAGGLPPYIQSQDPAEHDPETSIQSVVGSNFDELVLNSKKNVVVFFHRDGCKHCQATHPVLEKVAATFSNNEEVVFLQFETFLNDLRNKAIGKLASVPAIYMFPANQKDQPVLYNGGRTSQEAMEKWVRDKAPSEQESDL